jgi:hypothetical protein
VRTKKLRAVPLAVGVSAAILLGSAALLRHRWPERQPSRQSAVGSETVVASVPARPESQRPRDVVRPTPEVGVRDPEVERIYRDYRAALSTHDRTLEDALYPVLLAHREAALAAARREAVEAGSPEDRDWAERSIRFLTEKPSPPEVRRPRRDP